MKTMQQIPLMCTADLGACNGPDTDSWRPLEQYSTTFGALESKRSSDLHTYREPSRKYVRAK